VIYGGVYGGGWGAELILVDRAQKTACYACAARTLGRAGIDVAPAEPGQPVYALPRPTLAPLQADLTSLYPAAAAAAQLAIASGHAAQGFDRPLRAWRRNGASAWRLAFRDIACWKTRLWEIEPLTPEATLECPTCRAGGANQETQSLFESLLERGSP
jgi:hypothetical protein